MRKTLFLDVFSIVSAPHFLAENGVVSGLVQNPNLKIVFLIPEDEAYAEMVRPYLGEHTVAETIEKTIPHTLLQKSFLFFYSYLIFTGTTKMLATFGARVDAPPAGGNRHLWIVKALIANTFGRSRYVKTRIVPWLYKKIYSDRPFRKLFDRYKPDLVFVTNLAFNPGIELLAESTRRGVKTLGMAANWDHLNKYYIPIHADHLVVQNAPMKEEAVNYHAYNPEQVTVVGFPQFDPFSDPSFKMDRGEFFREFGIPENHKVILHISGSVYALDEKDILEEIMKWIEDGLFGPTTLMIRPYSGARDRKQEEEKYKRFFGRRNVVFNWRKETDVSTRKKEYASMFAYANVIISVFSTTAIEAAIFDKPTIAIGFDGNAVRPFHKSVRRLETLSHFKHVLETGSVYVAHTFSELRQKISEYLMHPEKEKREREYLVKKMSYTKDGKASARISEIVSRLTHE